MYDLNNRIGAIKMPLYLLFISVEENLVKYLPTMEKTKETEI